MRQLFLSLLLLLSASLLRAQQPADEQRRDSILALITGAQEHGGRTMTLQQFGGRGDGKTDNIKAFRRAMAYARKHGGLRLVVGEGVYMVGGPIHLASHVTLDLQEGSVVRFIARPELYLPEVATSWEGTFLWNYSPMIYGRGLTDVAIVGKGTIDGNAAETFSTWRPEQAADKQLSREMNHEERPVEERRFGSGHKLRPQLIQLYGCERVTLEGVKITNAPFWCVHLLQSRNIICRGLRYDAKLVNNDGIDPESCENVLIEDVWFDNGDDNVAIKSGRDNDGWRLSGPSRGIIIRRCHFKGLHAVVIGSEMSGGVEDVWVEDCDYSGYCKRGIYVKTNPNRGGYVRRLYVRHCKFGEVEDLLYVTAAYAGEGLDDDHYSRVEQIDVDGLSADRCRGAAIVVQGTPQLPVSSVSLRHVEVGQMERGVTIEHAEGVTMADCYLGGHAGVPSQAK